ncbi:MAG: hypothetical protein K8H74_01370 [Notoacmeibacter sp.]|nr:hypothetical protein [Notoacmeibacter sp.]
MSLTPDTLVFELPNDAALEAECLSCHRTGRVTKTQIAGNAYASLAEIESQIRCRGCGENAVRFFLDT